jgi:thiosulfate/3-mercaptopyruvate sulfurtransferase
MLIEADELAGMIGDENLRIFDATIVFDPSAEPAKERYLKAHIPGAVFLDHHSLSREDTELMFMLPGEAELADKIGAIGIGNDNPVVVYSTEMIGWATRIWWLLRYAGHRNVRVLNGGLAAWHGLLEEGENSFEPASFNPSLSPDMFATREEVMDSLKEGSACVVNALTPEIYRGETGLPYDGHISGSVNHPLMELMDGASLKSDEELKEIFAGKDTGDRMITYCGGGIAATVNACAAKLAGIEDVAVYDGSMSEWRSEGLPITTGAETGSIS